MQVGWLQKYEFTTCFTDHSHTASVRSIAVSESGVAASGSADETIKLFDTDKRVEIGSLLHHQGKCNCWGLKSHRDLMAFISGMAWPKRTVSIIMLARYLALCTLAQYVHPSRHEITRKLAQTVRKPPGVLFHVLPLLFMTSLVGCRINCVKACFKWHSDFLLHWLRCGVAVVSLCARVRMHQTSILTTYASIRLTYPWPFCGPMTSCVGNIQNHDRGSLICRFGCTCTSILLYSGLQSWSWVCRV